MKNGTIFCPNCGTTHNIVILDQPPQTVKLIHASEVNTDWILIKKAIMNGDAASVLSIGDGTIGAYSQRLYDFITGVQTGKVEDEFGWRMKV